MSLIDLAGHTKYLKTTLHGIIGRKPDYCLVCVSARNGLQPMTTEHIGICMYLKVPIVVAVTKIDSVSQQALQSLVANVAKMLTSPTGRRRAVAIRDAAELVEVLMADEDEESDDTDGNNSCNAVSQNGDRPARDCAQQNTCTLASETRTGTETGTETEACQEDGAEPTVEKVEIPPETIVPIFLVSSVTGSGLNLLKSYLYHLPLLHEREKRNALRSKSFGAGSREDTQSQSNGDSTVLRKKRGATRVEVRVMGSIRKTEESVQPPEAPVDRIKTGKVKPTAALAPKKNKNSRKADNNYYNRVEHSDNSSGSSASAALQPEDTVPAAGTATEEESLTYSGDEGSGSSMSSNPYHSAYRAAKNFAFENGSLGRSGYDSSLFSSQNTSTLVSNSNSCTNISDIISGEDSSLHGAKVLVSDTGHLPTHVTGKSSNGNCLQVNSASGQTDSTVTEKVLDENYWEFLDILDCKELYAAQGNDFSALIQSNSDILLTGEHITVAKGATEYPATERELRNALSLVIASGTRKILIGYVHSGIFAVGKELLLGPASNGSFVKVVVESIRLNNVPIRYATAGHTVTFTIKPLAIASARPAENHQMDSSVSTVETFGVEQGARSISDSTISRRKRTSATGLALVSLSRATSATEGPGNTDSINESTAINLSEVRSPFSPPPKGYWEFEAELLVLNRPGKGGKGKVRANYEPVVHIGCVKQSARILCIRKIGDDSKKTTGNNVTDSSTTNSALEVTSEGTEELENGEKAICRYVSTCVAVPATVDKS